MPKIGGGPRPPLPPHPPSSYTYDITSTFWMVNEDGSPHLCSFRAVSCSEHLHSRDMGLLPSGQVGIRGLHRLEMSGN